MAEYWFFHMWKMQNQLIIILKIIIFLKQIVQFNIFILLFELKLVCLLSRNLLIIN